MMSEDGRRIYQIGRMMPMERIPQAEIEMTRLEVEDSFGSEDLRWSSLGCYILIFKN